MRCPICGHNEDKVVDSREGRDGEFVRRRRECLACGKRYTTYEHVERVPLQIVKRDGRREEFDRVKLRNSIMKACTKRPISSETIDEMIDEIEKRLRDLSDREALSQTVGELVIEHLRKVDQVAYVRFASVYRQFQDPAQFVTTVGELGAPKGDKPRASEPRRSRR